MIDIAIATEDELSEAVLLRLIRDIRVPHRVTHRLRKNGNGYLRSKMDNWRQMAAHQVMVVLTDLDNANCLLAFRNEWLGHVEPPEKMLFRIAVREVEAWLLADRVAMRQLIGTRGVLPRAPDELADPKQVLLKLASAAPRLVRDDLVRRVDGNLLQGLGYNAHLVSWVNATWCPVRAIELSPSLERARLRLQMATGDV
jgi:hypothetical protein